MFSYPLAAQCAFCFPALIRLFFSLCPSHRLSQGCLFRLPLGWLPFLCHTVLSSHRSNAHHYISIILSSSVFHSSSPSLNTVPRHNQAPHGRLDFACVCVLQCASLPAPVLMLIVCVFVRHSALSQHQWADRSFSRVPPYLSVHIHSLHTLTLTHTNTQPPLPLQVPDSLLELLCPNSRSWQGECPLPVSLFLTQSSHLQPPLALAVSETMSIVSGRLGRARASWCLFVGLCTYSQLHNSAGCTHTE